jgi:hypothetical protein
MCILTSVWAQSVAQIQMAAVCMPSWTGITRKLSVHLLCRARIKPQNIAPPTIVQHKVGEKNEQNWLLRRMPTISCMLWEDLPLTANVLPLSGPGHKIICNGS